MKLLTKEQQESYENGKICCICKVNFESKYYTFKIYDVTTWSRNNYNTHIAQYLTKLGQADTKVWSGNRI